MSSGSPYSFSWQSIPAEGPIRIFPSGFDDIEAVTLARRERLSRVADAAAQFFGKREG